MSLIGLAVTICGAISPAAPPANQRLAFVVERVSDTPLPFQAVRLRLTVKNVTADRIEGLYPLESGCSVCAVQTPQERSFVPRRVRHVDLLRVTLATAARPRNVSIPFTLEPGESRSVTFAVSGHLVELMENIDREARFDPLFPTVGTYRLRCSYRYVLTVPPGTPAEFRHLYAEVDIPVEAPRAIDQPWLDVLRREPGLVRAMLQPISECTREPAAKLTALLKKEPAVAPPKSSYVHYARFALAKHYLDHSAEDGESWRVRSARAADQLELLRQGQSPFPFMPQVWLDWGRAAPELKEQAMWQLESEFRDSIEMIELMAPKLKPAEYQKFRRPRFDTNIPPPRAVVKP